MAFRVGKHLAAVAILVALIIIINAKLFFSGSSTTFLFVYGITITTVVLFVFLISLRYKDPSERLRRAGLHERMKKPLISCVLAVHNDEKIISRCVESLINSDYPNKEIIVVNDASTDSTAEVLSKYKSAKGVTIINLKENVGKKRAIGQGLRRAKGEIFVFTDSDCVVEPDAISRIVEVFVQDGDVGAMCGHGRALNSTENLLTKIQDSWYETQYSVKKAFESVYGSVSCISGPLAVYRRSAIYNYIPAWENDKFLGKEFRFATDRQLTSYVLGNRQIGLKLKRKYADSDFVKDEDYPIRDWKVLYCKSARVYTVVPNTMKKLIRQHIRWKKSFLRNLFSTGSFYWRKPIIPATKFYLQAAFTLLGPFVALRHIVYLPINGNLASGAFYLGGIFFIGAMYGLMYKRERPKSKLWIYRPFMSLISTLILSWLIFYSMLTIRKMVWHRS